jgi:type 1 fimbria pilin
MRKIGLFFMAFGVMLLMAVFAVPAAMGDVITTYAITFTGTGTVPTEGSFTYDSTNPQFINFSLTWDTINFDLHFMANDPIPGFNGLPSCVGSDTGAAASFDVLDGQCTNDPPAFVVDWEARSSGGFAQFFIQAVDSGFPNGTGLEMMVIAVPTDAPDATGQGEWTIAPVPEPPTCLLLLSSGALAAWRLRTRLLR